MKVRTPTSSESTRRFLRAVDLVGVFVASPVAMGLRDPTLFCPPQIGSAVTYCLIGSGAGLLMVIAFHLGRSVHDYLSAREVRSVVAASLAATALTAVTAFSFDRLNYVPRSLPLIQLLILCSLLLGGRALAMKRRGFAGPRLKSYLVESHTLLVSANDFAFSYLKMLDAFDVDRTNIVAILDRNPKLFGRAMLGHPIIGPPSAFARVVSEYKVHGVDITRILVCENHPKEGDHTWVEIDDYCKVGGVKLSFLSDILGFELERSIQTPQNPENPEVTSKGYRFGKRAFDLSLSVVAAIVISPLIILIALGLIIDLGWPIIFWQKRIGYCGRPFLIFKFRTLHAPYDRQGNFVAEDRRASRFGSLLRRLRLDELPQLWNVFTGEMSFVGPRPLLPIDQPNNGQLRLKVPPGVTGWAQINGGRQITADSKGSLDDWYVRHASFWLDARIILSTIAVVLFGEDRLFPRSFQSAEQDRQSTEAGRQAVEVGRSTWWARAANAQEGP